jgi:hypothetical protein
MTDTPTNPALAEITELVRSVDLGVWRITFADPHRRLIAGGPVARAFEIVRLAVIGLGWVAEQAEQVDA